MRLLPKVDFKKLNQLYNETARHLELLNLKESLQNNVDTTNLLNVALENVLFMFNKVSEDELIIADQLKDILRKTREALGCNFDQNILAIHLLHDAAPIQNLLLFEAKLLSLLPYLAFLPHI